MTKSYFNTLPLSNKYYFNTDILAFYFNTTPSPNKYFFNTTDEVLLESVINNSEFSESNINSLSYLSYFNTLASPTKYFFNVELVGEISDITTNYIPFMRNLEDLEEFRIDAYNSVEDVINALYNDVRYYAKLGRVCIKENESLLAYSLLFEYLTIVKQQLLDNKQYNITHSLSFYKELYKLGDIKLWFTKRNLPIQDVLDAFGVEEYLVDNYAYPKLDVITGNDSGIFEEIFE